MEDLHLDFETRSTIDLKKRNAYIYAEHPDTDVWCAAYAFGDEPLALWRKGEPCPARIYTHIMLGGIVRCWNAAFERLIFQKIMGPRYSWPVPTDDQFECVMAEALSMNLPGMLEKAALALNLDFQKDMAGHRLMLQMSKPRRIESDGTIVWWDDDDRKGRLYSYAGDDVEAERDGGKRIFRLSPIERETYLLDLKINDRGVYVDVDLCEKAQTLVQQATDNLDKLMANVTEGAVGACSNVSQLINWLKSRGIETDTVKKDALNDLLARDDLPDDVRVALECRKSAAKTSTAKLPKMLELRHADGRMRGNIQYHGASQTGRFAARGAQLHNLPRPIIKNVEQLVEVLNAGDIEWLEMMFDDPMQAIADAIRSCICAAPGNELMDADFANIEGRGIAWLAGEERKLQRFRAYDAGTGPDVYLVAASGIYNVPIADAGPYRQIGKVAELALGYQGGPGAFATMAVNYGVKVADTFETVWASASTELQTKALLGYESRGKGAGLSKKGWLAAECIKLAWRDAHPEIVRFWYGLEEAAIAAVRKPGHVASYRGIRYRKVGSFLFCLLPSSRTICYPYPRLEEKLMPWKDDKGEPVYKEALVFKAEDQWTRKWKDKDFYGGLAAENVTQAVARDVMRDAMLRVENAGFPVVLTVHDEIMSEVIKERADFEQFLALMAQQPEWAPGLPIAVDGWCGHRFRK